jgi:nucleotide-binding universal stress UspA family protein
MSESTRSVEPGPVVVGFDGTVSGQDALALARCASEVVGVALVVAVVHPAPAPISPARVDAEWVADRHRLAEEILDGARALIGATGAPARPVDYRIIASDSAAHGLHDLADEVGACVIVVGSLDKGPKQRLFASGTVERLLSAGVYPVAAAASGTRERQPRQLARIGVAYLDAPDARAALDLAARLAARTSAALHLYTVAPAEAEVMPVLVGPAGERAFSLTAREAYQRALDTAIAGLPPGVEATGHILTGDVVDALAELDSDEVDVLFCGSRGYGPARRALLGGVSTPLVRRALSPVVVVPRDTDRPAR